MKVFLTVYALNSALWFCFPGVAMIGIDPVIALFAIYGVSHLETLMLKLIIELERYTQRLNEETEIAGTERDT